MEKSPDLEWKTTWGWLRLSGGSYRNWGEMRNGMLAGRAGGGWEQKWWGAREGNGESEHIKKSTQMRGNSRPSPSHPETRAALRSSLHHQTHTADEYAEEPRKEPIADEQLPPTANPLPPGGSKTKRKTKGKERGQRPCTKNKTAAGPLKVMQLSRLNQWTRTQTPNVFFICFSQWCEDGKQWLIWIFNIKCYKKKC